MAVMKNDKDEKAWRVLRSEYLIKRPWLTARRDELELPDGRIVPEYYVLEYPDWVNVIAITADGHFVMERQYRHALGCTCFELPCGVMEEGETPLEAAKRELAEETGYGSGEWRELMVLSANPSTMTNLTHCFLATGVERVTEQHLDPTEELSVHLLSRDEVLGLLRNNEMMQSLMVAPLMTYLSHDVLAAGGQGRV